jgi:hypothetical protein
MIVTFTTEVSGEPGPGQLSSGLLQQDVIRDVLEDKPAERYEQLATVLGLDTIAGFPSAARKRADRLAAEGGRARAAVADAEAAARGARERIASLRERAENEPDVATLRAQLVRQTAIHAEVVAIRGDPPLSSDDADALRIAAGRLADTLGDLVVGIDPTLGALATQTPPTPADMEALQAAVDHAVQATTEASEILAEAEKRFSAESRVSSRLGRLAAEALPLLGDDCPVCGQAIEHEEVQAHLEEVVAFGSSRLPELQRARDEAADVFANRQREAEQAASAVAAARERSEEVSNARKHQEELNVKLEAALAELDKTFELGEKSAVAAGNRDAIQAAREALAAISRAARELAAALNWVAGAEALSAAKIRLSAVDDEVREARRRAARASAREDEGMTLQRAAVRAAASVTNERFAVLRPMIQDVYTRLAPHPSFTDLRFAVDVYRERGIASPLVSDPEHALTADPLLVFSSSQANVVALSAFLALGWAAGEDAMPFLLLDDPLQSLDDVNALGFADLCRHMRARRQLIVSTHDQRLASLLERKLAPRREDERARSLQFVAWSRRGPLIDGSDVTPQVGQGRRRALTASR